MCEMWCSVCNMQRVQWAGGQNQDASRGVALVTDKGDVMQSVWCDAVCVMWCSVCNMMQHVQWTSGQNQNASRGVALELQRWCDAMCVMWYNVCDEQAARIKMRAEELL